MTLMRSFISNVTAFGFSWKCWYILFPLRLKLVKKGIELSIILFLNGMFSIKNKNYYVLLNKIFQPPFSVSYQHLNIVFFSGMQGSVIDYRFWPSCILFIKISSDYLHYVLTRNSRIFFQLLLKSFGHDWSHVIFKERLMNTVCSLFKIL